MFYVCSSMTATKPQSAFPACAPKSVLGPRKALCAHVDAAEASVASLPSTP
jgi:hypothetical protein